MLRQDTHSDTKSDDLFETAATVQDIHPGMKPGDIFVALDDSELGKWKNPLCGDLYLKKQDGRKELEGSVLLYYKT